MKVERSGLRPSSSIAPNRQNQFNTSCWPLSSIWAMLATLKTGDKIPGYGRLLEEVPAIRTA